MISAARTTLPSLHAEPWSQGTLPLVGLGEVPAVRHELVGPRLCTKGEGGSGKRIPCVRKKTVATRSEDDTLTGMKEQDYHTFILGQLFFTTNL